MDLDTQDHLQTLREVIDTMEEESKETFATARAEVDRREKEARTTTTGASSASRLQPIRRSKRKHPDEPRVTAEDLEQKVLRHVERWNSIAKTLFGREATKGILVISDGPSHQYQSQGQAKQSQASSCEDDSISRYGGKEENDTPVDRATRLKSISPNSERTRSKLKAKRPLRSSLKSKNRTHSSPLGDEDIVASSEEDEFHMPEIDLLPQHPDDDQDVSQLIDHFVLGRLPPQLFNCRNQEDLRSKLSRFRANEWISDDLLRYLLQISGDGSNMFIADSLTLDVTQPNVTSHMTVQGLRGVILPFNVRGGTHWALAIVDYAKSTFTSFDLEKNDVERWAREFEKQQPEHKFEINTKDLPENPDNAACGLCCCLALAQYLGSHPTSNYPSNIRSNHLRILLENYRTLVYSNVLTRRESRTFPFLGRKRYLSDKIELSDFETMEPTPDDVVHGALLDDIGSLTSERKCRLLQMIMQCSLSDLTALQTLDDTSPLSTIASMATTMKYIVTEITTGRKHFVLPALRQRLLHIYLVTLYHSEIQRVEAEMKQQAEESVRLQNSKRKDRKKNTADISKTSEMSRPKTRGKSARNRVLDSIIKEQDEEPDRKLRDRLIKYLDIGSRLNHLVSAHGFGVLLILPASTVEPHDFLPTIDASCKRLEPSEYHNMSETETDFFVRWLPFYKGDDLRSAKSLDIRKLFLDENFWNKYDKLQGDKARSILSHRVKRVKT